MEGMKNVKSMAASLLFMSLFTTAAWGESDTANNEAADRWRIDHYYVSVSGGVGIVANDSDFKLGATSFDLGMDTGFVFNAAVGAYLSHHVRVEVEISHRSNDVDDVEVGAFKADNGGDWISTSLMFNGYYDFKVSSLPEPLGFYVGGGIGISFADLDLDGPVVFGDGDATVFSYQVMAGVSYQINDQWRLTAGYRIWSTEDPDFDGTDFDALLIHGVEFGVRFDF